MRDVNRLEDHGAAQIASIEVLRARTSRDGGTTEQTVKVRTWDKVRALELLAKHLGLLTEQVNLTLVADRDRLLEAGRQRNAEPPGTRRADHEADGTTHWRRSGNLVIGPKLETEGIELVGTQRDLTSLSVGTREQLATVLRLTIADVLGSTVVLDDQLVQSDASRMDWLRSS